MAAAGEEVEAEITKLDDQVHWLLVSEAKMEPGMVAKVAKAGFTSTEMIRQLGETRQEILTNITEIIGITEDTPDERKARIQLLRAHKNCCDMAESLNKRKAAAMSDSDGDDEGAIADVVGNDSFVDDGSVSGSSDRRSSGGGVHGGPLNPCGGCVLGLVCLVISAVLLWKNEGQYVQTLQAMESSRSKLVEVCSGGCAQCDFSQVLDRQSGKTRPLRDGDVVYMSCGINNMQHVSSIANPSAGSGFPVQELAGALQTSDARQVAARYAWNFEMLQSSYTDLPKETSPDLRRYMSGRYAYKPRDYCRARQAAKCQAWSTKKTATSPPADSEVAFVEVSEQSSAIDPENQTVLYRRRLKSSDQTEKPIKVQCERVQFCTASNGWTSQLEPSPASWASLPLKPTGKLKYVSPPAFNLRTLAGGSWDNIGSLEIGAKSGDAFSLQGIAAKAGIFSSTQPVRLKQKTAESTINQKMLPMQNFTLTGSTRGGSATCNVGIVNYDRSDVSAKWTTSNTNVLTNNCPEGCLCGGSSAKGVKVGDLRVCILQSTTESMSIITGAKRINGVWTLTETRALKTVGGSLREGNGFIVALNRDVSADDLFDEEIGKAGNVLVILRYILPIIMWIGFYCCLSPIVYIIDQLGDAVASIPCIGSIAGGLANCIEALAEIMICIVSCCSALACSLLVASIAWLRFRPAVGIPMLLAAVGLAGVLLFFASGQGGKRRSNARVPAFGASQGLQGMGVELPQFQATAPQPGAYPWQVGTVQPHPSAQSQAFPGAPPPAAMPMAQAVAPVQQFQVVCPSNASAGMQVQVSAPDGRQVVVAIPVGVGPGQAFLVQM